MKLLIKPSASHSEHIEALFYLQTLGHIVKQVTAPLYFECAKDKYDCLVIADTDLNTEVQQLKTKYKLNLMVVNNQEITIFTQKSKKSFNLSRFANTFKYRATLPDKDLSSDIYIHCTNDEILEFAQNLSRENKKIKVSAGGLINCTNFVGIVNETEIMKLAKSSKITLCNNQVLLDSLIFNGIGAFHIKDYFAITDDFNIEEYILEEQKKIQPLQNFLSKLNEELSHIN